MTKKDLLLTLLKESVDKCYKKDIDLIDCGMERASVAKIHCYMVGALEYDKRFEAFSKYNLENEYNKNGKNPKKTENFTKGAQPDIILHYRLDKPHKDNLLVVEFKSFDGKDHERDKLKLKDFTGEESGYNYFLGVFVILHIDGPEYMYFQDGYEKPYDELST
ncbi:MAG: hypothetical protein FWD82_03445 [Defluviitaleaceae bacterium]|nr:hypothetical protein [Defluviitaleaceae bacterium]